MNTNEQPYPLLCKPVLKTRIWGGRKLEELFGIELPPGEKIGEAWLVADLPEGASSIANGPQEGQTLSALTAKWGEAMIGAAWRGRPTGARYPLLVKFLDAQDNLSVQVHPSDEDCRRYFPDAFSKDESWIISVAEPGGKVFHGFKPGTTLEDFDHLLAEGRVEECLRPVEVAPGDVYRVSAGTIHALCRGVALLEIQEPSDTTFRVYDYNRLGDDGKPRPLHIEQARKVMRFGDDTPPRIEPQAWDRPWGRREILVDCHAYRIERIEVKKTLEWKVNPASTQVLIVTEGAPTLTSETISLPLKKGASVVLPAALGTVRLDAGESPATCVLAGAGGVPMIER